MRPILLFLCLLLAACGTTPAGEPPTVAPEPTVAASPTAAPSPTPAPTLTPAPSPTVPVVAPASFEELPGWLAEAAGTGATVERVAGALLEGGFLEEEGDLRAADMNGDGVAEWALRVLRPVEGEPMPWGRPGVVLLLDPATGEGEAWGGMDEELSAPSLLALEDLTGDGLADLLYEFTDCGASTCFQDYHLLSYQGGALADVLGGDQPETMVSIPYSEATVADRTGDGVADLVVVGGGFGSVGAGPQRGSTLVYSWDGERLALAETIHEPSPLRYFTLLDANAAFDAGEYERAIALYDEAAKSETLEESGFTMVEAPRTEAEAIARVAGFRLVLAYLALGETERALGSLEWLQAEFPDDSMAEAAEILVGQYEASGELATACAAVEEFAALIPQFTSPLDDMGYANPSITADTLCPFDADSTPAG